MHLPARALRTVLAIATIAGAFAVIPATDALALTQNADSTWQTNGKVYATVQYGNVMFIGGTFTQVRELAAGTSGGQVIAANNLAAIDMTTGKGIASFHPDVLGSGLQKVQIHSLAVVGNSLYVGGQFSKVDGADHYNLAKIDIDPGTMTGTVDPAFTTAVGVPGASNENTFFVYEILPGNGGIYIGGAFAKVNGSGRSKTAKLNLDGSLVSTFKTTSVNSPVRDMQFALDGQTIFVAGAFSNFNGVARQSIVRISPSTGANDAWAIPPGGVIVGGSSHPGMTCWSLAVTSTRLFAGCGRGPNYDAAFRLDNGNSGDRTWSFSTSGNDQAIALSPDGQRLIIGGHFGTFLLMQVCGQSYLKNLGILDNLYGTSTPTLDCSFLPQFYGPNAFGGVWEIQVTPTFFWVGGEFTTINGIAQRSIARFTW